MGDLLSVVTELRSAAEECLEEAKTEAAIFLKEDIPYIEEDIASFDRIIEALSNDTIGELIPEDASRLMTIMLLGI